MKQRNIHPNEPKVTPSRGGHTEKFLQCDDCESNTKNICIKFNEKKLNSFQEMEERTLIPAQKETYFSIVTVRVKLRTSI